MDNMAENITSKTILKAKLIAIVFALILIYPVIDQTFKITMRKKLNVTKKPLTKLVSKLDMPIQ